jgi:hypothetical protein
MVDWMDPLQLAQTGVRAVLAATFGAYADKRELQAALQIGGLHARFVQERKVASGAEAAIALLPEPDQDFSSHVGEFWIDFVADLGDGFDATYTIARLLAEPALRATIKNKDKELARGNILVMGGDQVYPAATRAHYRDHLEGPYTAALPAVLDEPNAPMLYALPGNHDWYDGLTSFMRLFCQQRWIGGWRTRQRRSYFAIKLPHNWWLWGIDIQLSADIDLPQIEFFERIADSDPCFAGSKVILCTGRPSWTEEIHRERRDRLCEGNGYANLGYFEKRVIVKRGAEPVLTLTGDAHHYCRYVSANPEGDKARHKITAGGGGAYLLGTHSMPEQIELDDSLSDEDPPVIYKRGPVLFPSRQESIRLTFGALLFAWKGRRLALMLGVIYLFNVWLIQSASERYGETFLGKSIAFPLDWHGLGLMLSEAALVFGQNPASAVLSLMLFGGLLAFAGTRRKYAGILHGLAHLFANLVLAWLFAVLNFAVLHPGFDRTRPDFSNVAEQTVDRGFQTLAFACEMVAAGSLVAGSIFGLYLTICALVPPRFPHIDEAFSAQGIPDFKNFLRLRIDTAGKLALFPIGVRKIRRWSLRDKKTEKPQNHEPWFKSDDQAPLDSLVHLIEGPVEFASPRSAKRQIAQRTA